MSYSEVLAQVVAGQLARFVTLNRYQLAGHVANLNFWAAEARHTLDVLDGYQERFRRLKTGLAEHVATHNTVTFLPFDPDISGPPAPLRGVPDRDLREARRQVVDATYGFF